MTETAALAEAMRDQLMAHTGVSQHIAAAALGWALKHYFPADDAPDDDASIADWSRKMHDGMAGYALGLAAMEQHMIDRARGARDDLHALALRARGIGDEKLQQAKLAVGARHNAAIESARIHRGRADSYISAANLLSQSFAIGEASYEDPADANPIRMLDDEGNLRDARVTYVERGVLMKPRELVAHPGPLTIHNGQGTADYGAGPESGFDPAPEDHPLVTVVDQPWPADRSCDE